MEKRKLNKRKILYICISLVLCIYAVSMLLPLWYMVINSFKSTADYSLNKWGMPAVWEFGNYFKWSADPKQAGAFFFSFPVEKGLFGDQANVWVMYANSIILTVVGVVLNTVATVCVAYACARFDFMGKKLIVALGIGALVFPDFGSGAVVYKLFSDWGWLNTWMVLTPKLNPFGLMFLILYSQFSTVSKTYAEAAKIDGASELRIFLQIMVPMVKGVIGMALVMSAIGSWNDFYTSYMYLPQQPTLALGFFKIGSETALGITKPVQFGFILVGITPLLVFFIAMRDVIIENAAAGGIKG